MTGEIYIINALDLTYTDLKPRIVAEAAGTALAAELLESLHR